MATAFISHRDCARHEMGAVHPECPARLAAISDQLIASGLDMLLRHYEAPLASREQLGRVHDEQYIATIFQLAPTDEALVWIDPDTAMNSHTLTAALRAAGAAVRAVDLVMKGEVSNAFCSVRPPGHHAEHNRAMGFCFFNNVAVAAAHALETWGLERVAIIDFDVHHGNGSEDIFKDQAGVLLCSTFQHPFFPYSDASSSNDHIINVPLPAGTTGEEFRRAVQARWLQPLAEFKPQLILISAGFDGHVEDEMAEFNLTEQDYAWVTDEVITIADACCDGRIVSVLEGGYALPALGRSVAAHLRALLG